MEKIYDQLDEVKVEVENIREECGFKAPVGHRAKSQQENLEIDILARELHSKSQAIFEIRQLYEDLQSSLHRKDLFLQQINAAHEKLQAEQNDRTLKLEGECRDLGLSLDEALARIQVLEKKACASSEEIAGLNRLLSIKQEKNSEVEKNVSKYMKERDKCILKLEEDSRISRDQLKWKNEQFSHLEEAHKKLQVLFQESKLESQKEKSSLLDEISSLQDNLDAQIRVSEGLETHLRICNQALAHEESRRKVLEIEVFDCRSKLGNVFLECQEARSEIEQLVIKRDGELAELRTILRKKEILANEMKYKMQQLKQDNSDLIVSLKDAQDSQLHNNAASSLERIRNKLQGLEQLHSKCEMNLEKKETEWNSKIKKLTEDVNQCLSELAVKNRSIRELHKELEDYQCLLEVKSEEIFILVMVLRSEFFNAYSNLHDANEKLDMGIMQFGGKNMVLDQQLHSKNAELHKVHTELKQKSDEVAALMERVESLESLKQKDNNMEEELRRLKAMLDESNEYQSRLEHQLQELENTHIENLKNALEEVYTELAIQTSEINKYTIALQESKSEVGVLKSKLKENQQAHEKKIADLLVIMNEKDAKIGKLEEEIFEKREAAELLNQEKYSYIRLAEDRDCSIKGLQNEIFHLKNDLAEKQSANNALLVARDSLGQENERLSFSIKERDQKLQELEKKIESLFQELQSATVSLAEKEVMLDEALQAAECQKVAEVEKKNQVIADLENKVNGLREKVESKENSLLQSKLVALQVEEAKKSEMQELRSQLEKEKRSFEGLLEELESHKRTLFEHSTNGGTERENLVAQLEGMCGKIGVFCKEDVELMGMLGKLTLLSEEDSETVTDLLNDGLSNTAFSPFRKYVQVNFDERTPLTELNC